MPEDFNAPALAFVDLPFSLVVARFVGKGTAFEDVVSLFFDKDLGAEVVLSVAVEGFATVSCFGWETVLTSSPEGWGVVAL